MKFSNLRKTAAVFLALITLTLFAVPCFADSEIPPEPPIEYARAAVLYNFENDRILFEHNAAETVYPASTVKIMTAIVIMEHYADKLNTPITVTQAMLDEVSGNRIGFSVGEVVTVEQMLNCMLVNSANDAAIILAHACAGSTAAFVKKMNEKAAWIGAYNTVYTNPTGMHHDDMVTTARDTAVIAKYAYAIPGFIDITSTPKYVMDATNVSTFRSIYNRNCMISKYYSVEYYYSRAVGMNAGATTQGGYALCAVAEDGESGLTYLAVVLGAESVDGVLYNYINAESMLDWAYAAYDYVTVLSSKKMICELSVRLSSTLDYVTLVPAKDITVYMPASVNVAEDIRYSYNTYADVLDAPVQSGQEAGTITVLYGDEILGSCPLITTSSITRSEFLHFLAQVEDFSHGRFFRGTVISVVVLAVLYVFIKAGLRERKLRRTRGEWRR
ncbi:MAG: D-alanyl-D-alanine carboxypeptidase [Clostridia bacterium]|nr:D-alanyl-D-alanine carboxypeptidase [Clostridia bacterium]